MGIDDLIKRRKLLKGVLTAFGTIWLLLLSFGLFVYFTKSTGTMLIPLGVLPMTMLPMFFQYKMLTNEIKSRQLK